MKKILSFLAAAFLLCLTSAQIQAQTWTVAGSSTVLFGTAWSPSTASNDMVLQSGSTYKWEKTNLALEAETIEFKVCKDHEWTTAYPSSNYQLQIPTAATYTVTITFNASSKAITAVATKTSDDAPQEVDHTWTVAGSSTVAFTASWDPSAEANDMVKQADGTYKWEKADLALTAETIEFKVCKDHAWGTAYPSQNYQLAIPSAGTYTIVITYNDATHAVAATATKAEGGDEPGEATWYIHGYINGNDYVGNDYPFAEGVATLPELTADSYIYLHKDNGTAAGVDFWTNGWTEGAETVTMTENPTPYGDKMLVPVGTQSVYMCENADGTLKVSRVALDCSEEEPGDEPQPQINYYFIGSMINWSLENAIPMDGDSIVKTIDAEDVGTYQFKILPADKNWDNSLGFTDINTECSSEGLVIGTDNNNIKATFAEGEVKVKVVGGKLCITGNFVEEQVELKNIEIRAYSPDFTPKIHFWGNSGVVGSDWDNLPDMNADTEQEGWFSYIIENAVASEGINFLFKNDEAQSADLHTDGDVCYDVRNIAQAALLANCIVGGGDEPVEHSYTVAGNLADVFGAAWDPALAANDMALQADGTYKWEKSEITLPAGAIQFKVCQDHAWNVAYPGENYNLNISESGIYTINITFNAVSHEITAEATKSGEAVVMPTIQLAGQMTDWGTSPVTLTPAQDNLTASVTVPLEAQDYLFKIISGGTWLTKYGDEGNNYTLHRDWTTADHVNVIGGTGNDLLLQADVAGDYTFTWTYADSSLFVTFPAIEPEEHTYTVAGNSPEAFGETWNPALEANDMAKQADGTYKWEKENVTLQPGEFKFKVCEDHGWAVSYPEQDYVLPIADAGVYTITITFNAESKDIVANATKTGEAAVINYYLVGSMQDWNADNAYPMENDELVLTLEANVYQFKIMHADKDWGNLLDFNNINAECSSEGIEDGYNHNVKFTLAQDGEVTVKVVEGQLCVTGDFGGEIVITTWNVVGDEALFGESWNIDSETTIMTLGEDGKYRYEIESVALIPGEYKWKIVGNHDWNVAQYPQQGDYIINIAEEGNYRIIFTLDLDANAGTEEVTKLEEPVETTYYLAGTFTNWGEGRIAFENGAVAVTLEQSEEAAAFKIIKTVGEQDTWYGNAGTMTEDNCTGWKFETTIEANAGLTLSKSGLYTFNLTLNEQGEIHISVVYPSGETGIEAIMNAENAPAKFIYNGQLFIRKAGRLFNAQGQLVR